RNDIDVVWWTDHDWRMEAYGYYDGIAFDGTDEGGGLQWFVQNDGALADADHAFVDDPHSPDEPGKALRVSASGPEAEWGASFLWAKAGNSFYSTDLSDTTLTIDVLGERVGPDAELVVQLETSYRPATAGRPAGVYVLEYRLAATAGRRLADPLTGVVAVASDGVWQRLAIHPVDDVRAFWPDLVAEDSGLARVRFGVRARNGATASGVFDRLRFDRTRDPLRWPVRTRRDLMRQLRSRCPGVTQLLSAEVSMVRHMNVFMEDFELYPYPPRGKAPVLDNSVEAAEAMVRWYHERGALVQYNHPPINPGELVTGRALGADLIEIANADGDFTVIRDRIDQYDVAARNAIFLTATSQVDDHGGRDWQGKPHLYTTAVWAESRQARDLLTALAAGQAWWYHQRLWPTGQLDLAVGGRRAMGRVVRTSATRLPVDIVANNLPEDSTVQVVVGECDRTGQTTPAVTRHTYPVSSFASGRLRFQLERENGRYLRVEVRDAGDVLLGFGNPVWLLSPRGDVEVPRARRLSYTGR
ncbi:hypothetical protein SAMN05421678_12850, partial [Actinopolymorpha cephalotaxi]